MLYAYRDALMWQRGQGLCALEALSTHAARIHAMQLRLTTFIPTHMQGGYSVLDDSTRLMLTQAPTSEPLEVSDAKQFLRIEHTADDAAIGRAITAAREAVEQYLGMALLPQEYSFSVGEAHTIMSLPVGPAQSIVSVTATPESGSPVTVAAEHYRLSLDGFAVIFQHVPQGRSVNITYAAHYAATAEALPALLKQGMLHHVAVMLEDRAGAAPMPLQSLQCYQPFRRVRL